MLRLALVTDSGHPDCGGEAGLLEAGLREAGIASAPVVWDDPSVDWSAFDGAAIRSTWDYIARVARFRRWLSEAGALTRIANPAPVVTWNADKRYLEVLAQAGVPVIDTMFIPPGSTDDLPLWPDLVVKPAVSSGARRTHRFGPESRDGARQLVAAIHADGLTALVQPYLPAVDTEGETDVVVFGRTPSHAVVKGAILPVGDDDGSAPGDDGTGAQEADLRPVPLDGELVTFAAAALDAIPGRPDLLYARVDSAIAPDGSRRLMELELVEPYLFLSLAPDPEAAAARFAVAVHRWLDC